MKLNREIEQWEKCNPRLMATNLSFNALEYAIKDARHDILALHRRVRQLEGYLLETISKFENVLEVDVLDYEHQHVVDLQEGTNEIYQYLKRIGVDKMNSHQEGK